ncbi:MAG TPA: hypothetical protein VGZ22_23450 [Isosphaeraceae bacterium]|jgi:hypothetical protein|nr:hypothetical protein [Isosphaeraceae bacterium]
MKRSRIAEEAHPKSRDRARLTTIRSWPCRRPLGVLTLLLALIALMSFAGGSFSRGNDEPAGSAAPKDDGPSGGATRALEKRLRALRLQAARIAEELLPDLEKAEGIRQDLINQTIRTQQAEAFWRNAELSLQVAKSALVEYTEGIVEQKMATFDGEIELSKAKILRFADDVEESKQIQKEISEAQGNYPADILARFLITRILEEDEHNLTAEKLGLELATTNRENFVKHERPNRVKELESDIAKADAEERAKMATLSLERQKEEMLKQSERGLKLDPLQVRLQHALSEAFAIEGKLATLQSKNAGQPELDSLADQFQAKIDEAEAILDEFNAMREYEHFKSIRQRFR